MESSDHCIFSNIGRFKSDWDPQDLITKQTKTKTNQNKNLCYANLQGTCCLVFLISICDLLLESKAGVHNHLPIPWKKTSLLCVLDFETHFIFACHYTLHWKILSSRISFDGNHPAMQPLIPELQVRNWRFSGLRLRSHGLVLLTPARAQPRWMRHRDFPTAFSPAGLRTGAFGYSPWPGDRTFLSGQALGAALQ